MKFKKNITKYYEGNTRITKAHGVGYLILGFIMIALISYGFSQLHSLYGNPIDAYYADPYYSSDSGYYDEETGIRYDSDYDYVYSDCMKECKADYGVNAKIIVKEVGAGFDCDCQGNSAYSGYTLTYYPDYSYS